MGSAPRADRCRHFIREFCTDYVRKLGFGVGTKLVVVAEALAFDERDECVRFQVTARPENADGEEIRFHIDPVFFTADDPPADQIVQVADDLEMDADEVRRRFVTAGLSRGRR